MCGIAGAYCIDAYDKRLDVALPLLGVFMEDRGTQSWGWTNGTDIDKHVGRVRTSLGPQHLGHKTTLLHTRHATWGAQTAENSHPFAIKDIIGVHNGMIYNHTEIAKKYDITYNVDSEIIFHQIANSRPTSELEGYGAVVYFRGGILHLGTFSNRGDMVLAKTDFGWVWASTETAIKDALGIAGVRIDFLAKMKHGVLYQLLGHRIVKTLTPLTISETKPTTGPTSWQDFQGGYRQGNGYSAYDSYYNDKYAEAKGATAVQQAIDGLVHVGKSTIATAQQQTLLAEPSSDADEVIDVTDPAILAGAQCFYCTVDATKMWQDAPACDDCYDFFARPEEDDFNQCEMCEADILGEPVVIRGEMFCAECADDAMEENVERDAREEAEYEMGTIYHFRKDVFQPGQSRYTDCDDCVLQFEAGDEMFVEDAEGFASCPSCHDKNYMPEPEPVVA